MSREGVAVAAAYPPGYWARYPGAAEFELLVTWYGACLLAPLAAVVVILSVELAKGAVDEVAVAVGWLLRQD